MKSKIQLNDFISLGIISIISIALWRYVGGKEVFNNHFEIDLHDTYFITSAWLVLFFLFVLISFPVYLIKTRKHHYQRKNENVIAIILGLLFMLCLFQLINLTAALNSPLIKATQTLATTSLDNGWTVHPSIAKHANHGVIQSSKGSEIFIRTLIGIGLCIVCALINLSYHWGKQTNSTL